MLFELRVALRFLLDGKAQTIFILLGIALGVAVQIFLSAIITGVQLNLIDQTIGTAAHIVVRPKDAKDTTDNNKNVQFTKTSLREKKISNYINLQRELSKTEGVKNIAAFVEGSGFINAGQRNNPILIRGTSIKESNGIYKFNERMYKGEANIEGNDVIIGKELAKDLNLDIGDSINVSTAAGKNDIFHIGGIFDFKNSTINKNWVFMGLARAQKFIDSEGSISSIELQIIKPFESENTSVMLGDAYKEVSFESWQKANGQLLTALKSQSSSSDIIQFFVLMAVALGISSVLAVSVMQKSKQIGILKAMGANDRMTGVIFILQGAILGILGGILGGLFGLGLIEIFKLATSSGEVTFTINIDRQSFITSAVIATAVSIFAAFWPSVRSSRLNPIEVIRNG